MRKTNLLPLLIFILSLALQPSAYGENNPKLAKEIPWPQRIGNQFQKIWRQGNTDLYMTGYAWHNRYLYTQERLAVGHYNENAWGGGLGKGLIDEDGDWQGLYAIAFLDSHKNVEPWGGYAFLKTAHLDNNVSLGAGFTVALTMRPDIFHNIPFPAATPLVNISFKRLSLFAAYVPGHQNIGNILFMFGKWTLPD